MIFAQKLFRKIPNALENYNVSSEIYIYGIYIYIKVFFYVKIRKNYVHGKRIEKLGRIKRLELRRSLRQDREADSQACRSKISERK